MTTSQKLVSAVIGLWLVALTVGVFAGSPADVTRLGATNNVGHLNKLVEWFEQTVYFGTTQQTKVSSSGALTIGSTGNAIAGDQWGTCSLIAPSFTVAASSTVPMDCAVTGALTTDTWIMTQFATGTTAGKGVGWRVVGSAASSTAGFITLGVSNETGASAVIPASIASSTKYEIRR